MATAPKKAPRKPRPKPESDEPWFAKYKPYAKSVAGFLVPGLSLLFTSITSGSDGGSTITNNEWSAIGLAMLTTGGAVFYIKNKGAEKG